MHSFMAIGRPASRRKRDSAFAGDNLRTMEATDWVSLSDQDLLEHRIS